MIYPFQEPLNEQDIDQIGNTAKDEVMITINPDCTCHTGTCNCERENIDHL